MANFNGQDFNRSAPKLESIGINTPRIGQIYSITGGSGAATVLHYEMRAKLTGNFVYWMATSIDVTGSEYPGGPVGLSEIVFIKANLF